MMMALIGRRVAQPIRGMHRAYCPERAGESKGTGFFSINCGRVRSAVDVQRQRPAMFADEVRFPESGRIGTALLLNPFPTMTEASFQSERRGLVFCPSPLAIR